jgi:hypothetical protein
MKAQSSKHITCILEGGSYFFSKHLTTEFVLAKEFLDLSKKGVILYFDVILCGNEFCGLKKRKFTK